MLWLDEGYWPDAKTSPHWTSEGGLDFSIYGCCVQYYADEELDGLKKGGNTQIYQIDGKISASGEQNLFGRALESNFFQKFYLEINLADQTGGSLEKVGFSAAC